MKRFFSAVDENVKGDEFWDYDQQVDLEGFTSGRLYGILAKQSREVTAAIARQKDQVRIIISLVTAILTRLYLVSPFPFFLPFTRFTY